METTTRYIGTCGACGRAIKVSNGKLVHHGYERPGYGYIEGDCFGVHYEPHEKSPKCAEDYRATAKNFEEATKKKIEGLSELTEITVNLGTVNLGTVKYPRIETYKADGEGIERYRFEKAVEGRKRSLERRVRHFQDEVIRMDVALKDWAEQELTTVEEEKAQKQAAKADREKARREKAEAKIDAQVAKYQKRLASASRTKAASVFLQIFEGAPGKLNEVAGVLISLSRKEVYERIGNIEMWQKVGLLDEKGEPVYYDPTKKYNRYQVPYDVQNKVTEAIKAGAVGEVKF